MTISTRERERRLELKHLRAMRRRLLALDGPGTCPCCPRMDGQQHYTDCAIFRDRAIEFVIEETENLRGITRYG